MTGKFSLRLLLQSDGCPSLMVSGAVGGTQDGEYKYIAFVSKRGFKTEVVALMQVGSREPVADKVHCRIVKDECRLGVLQHIHPYPLLLGGEYDFIFRVYCVAG